ncbi:sugar ABC transporter permease [Streptomyces sp. NPDC026672]|uniref:ABC transporter permease subunit n=1 Tax=unclassified Streptomyces TaxID=2593676 RepID=UPI0033E32393
MSVTRATRTTPTGSGQVLAPIDLRDERLVRADGPRGAVAALTARVRGGDLGSLPVVIGLVLIAVVFQSLNGYFLSSANLVELATECAAVGTISLGIVLVLLLGQIDLSVGSMSGLAAAILGVGLTRLGWSVWTATGCALAAGLLVGLLYGAIFIRFSVPSFVITLGGLLTLLGLQLNILGSNGSINLPFDSWIVRFSQQTFVARPLSYVLAALVAAGYLASRLARHRRRRRHSLSVPAPTGVLVRAGVLLAALEAGCWYLNRDRGVSAPFVLFVVLVVALDFTLTRTRWGRSVFAVGGSVEAARRVGIRVDRVHLAAFALCSLLATLGGLLAAGRLATASTSSGVGDTNLNAIAAAVIGGTSLFGGRGGAYSALLGIAVIQAIASGLTLLNLSSAIRFVITGVVLLVAVVVDSLARRSRAAHGRA